MNIKIWAMSTAVLSLVGMSSLAQDNDIEGLETLDQQEHELPAMPRVKGPITIIQSAALVFAGFDNDGDYIISQAEAQAGATTAFVRADRDQNGKVSLFELEDWREAALGSLAAVPGNLNFDIDYDNQVSRDEFMDVLMKLFKRHDADENGSLKTAELMQILEVPRRKDPGKEKLSDRECAAQIQRNRTRF